MSEWEKEGKHQYSFISTIAAYAPIWSALLYRCEISVILGMGKTGNSYN